MCRVSVIVPTHNRPEWLAKAIASVLMQSWRDFELIVVNDDDVDVTGICERYSRHGLALYETEKNRGVSRARNIGAGFAKGEFLAFLDDDDAWDHRFLEIALKTIQDHDIDLVAAGFWRDYGNGVRKHRPSAMPPLKLELGVLRSGGDNLAGISGSTIMVRKSLFEQVTGFDERLPTGEDSDLVIRQVSQYSRKTDCQEPTFWSATHRHSTQTTYWKIAHTQEIQKISDKEGK